MQLRAVQLRLYVLPSYSPKRLVRWLAEHGQASRRGRLVTPMWPR